LLQIVIYMGNLVYTYLYQVLLREVLFT